MGEFVKAVPVDASALGALLEEESFSGPVSLLYTRRPDAYDSFQREGRDVSVIVYREDGNVAGFGACAVNSLFYGGTEQNIGYLFAFRIGRDNVSLIRTMPRGYRTLFSQVLPCRTFFTTILSDNSSAIRFLEKKRRTMPEYEYLGEIFTLSLRTGGKSPLHPEYGFTRVTESDIPDLIRFYREEGSRFQFFPVLTEKDLTEGRLCPRYDDFYLVRNKDGTILAAGAVWDQRSYKQYRVTKYSLIIRIMRPLINLLSPLTGTPRLPRPPAELNFFVLGYFLVRGDDGSVCRFFLRHILSRFRRFDFCSLGFFERHPLLTVVRSFRRSREYRSRLYRVTPAGETSEPFIGIPHVEIGRL